MNNPNNLDRIPSPKNNENLWGEKNRFRTFLLWLSRLAISFFAISIFSVLLLRWVNPPTTSFMLQRQYQAWQNSEESFELRYEWRGWSQISPAIKIAAITSEDQGFARHWGIDLNSIRKAINEYEQGQDLRGASTITQQVAKNLFLWPASSYLRKGIEAYFALLVEMLWSKERILEMYLNIVEFGDGIYGVQAAAQHYFDTSAANLSKWQSALMVTALPAPKRYNLANPSQYMLERRTWVLRYMNFLGNERYLQKLK